jgi:hypothetical protein
MKMKILAIKDASFTDLKCTFNKRHNIYGTLLKIVFKLETA